MVVNISGCIQGLNVFSARALIPFSMPYCMRNSPGWITFQRNPVIRLRPRKTNREVPSVCGTNNHLPGFHPFVGFLMSKDKCMVFFDKGNDIRRGSRIIRAHLHFVANLGILQFGNDRVDVHEFAIDHVIDPGIAVKTAAIGTDLSQPWVDLFRAGIDTDHSRLIKAGLDYQLITGEAGRQFLSRRPKTVHPRSECVKVRQSSKQKVQVEPIELYRSFSSLTPINFCCFHHILLCDRYHPHRKS